MPNTLEAEERMEGDPIGDRLRRFRKSCAECSTQKAFAQALQIDQQRLSGYENGTRIPHHVVAALVRMGANPYWLLFGDGSMRGTQDSGEDVREMTLQAMDVSALSPSERQMSEFYILPLYADEVAAGQPREVRDTDIEGPAVIHRNWCPHPRETEYVRVHTTGTSMEPTIPAGSMVTIDRSQTDAATLVGKVVALAMREGGVTLKRLQRDGRGGYVGVPDNNSGHHAIPLGEGDRIVGLVQTIHARLA